MQKAYERINWENYPSEATAINEDNLNKMDAALDELDSRIVTHEVTKLDKTTAYGMVKDITFDESTGIFTVTYLSGSVVKLNTKLEKMMVNFNYDKENQQLVITLDDGTKQYVDMSALITEYEFVDSDTMAFTANEDGTITATVKKGSITADMLYPNFLADIKIQADTATAKAKEASNSAASALASEESAADSAERAEEAYKNASAVTNVQIATQEVAGLIKGGDNYIAEDGELVLTRQTTATTLENSHAGGLHLIGVSGKSEQETTKGNQLFDASKLPTKNAGGATVTNNGDGSFTISGSGTLSADLALNYIYSHEETLNMLKVGTLTFNTEVVSYPYCFILLRDGANKQVAQLHNKFLTTGTTLVTVTEELLATDGLYLTIGFYGFARETIVPATIKPMLYQDGDGTWEKYTGGVASPNPEYPSEIKSSVVSEIKTHGKNCLTYPYYYKTITHNGITYTDNGDGTITANGTATANSVFMCAYDSEKLFKEISGKTVTISGCPSGGSNDGYAFQMYNLRNDNAVVKEFGAGKTFTVSNDTPSTWNISIIVVKGTTVNNLVFKPMLNMGTTALPFEPYTETVATLSSPIELHGINDVADVLATENVTRRFVEVVFDGSDDEKISTYDLGTVTRISIDLATMGRRYSYECLCDKLSYVTSYNRDEEHFYVDVSKVHLFVNNNALANYDTLRGYLAENPYTVVYPLAEEVTEELPTADKISLLSLKTFDGTTHVFTDSEVEPIVEAEYGTSKVGALSLENSNLHEVIKAKDYDSLKANTVGVRVNLSTTAYDNMYTAECDGYAYLDISMSESGHIYFRDANDNVCGSIGASVPSGESIVHSYMLFVKKGMKMYVAMGKNSSAWFYGLQ